jgi:N-acetyl-D-muramate 6-phosphate phosphatase
MTRAVLFDLDGTLADTAPDLGGALNTLLAEHGKAPLPLERIRPHVSHGARGMLQIGFGLTPADARFETLRQSFLDVYEANLCVGTALFPGMAELLAALEARHLTWGIVTNKPKRFTEPLIDLLNLSHRAACIVSGDSAARAKPHPDTLLAASRIIDVAPNETLYVGDDERDVIAARAAAMGAVVALYGYLGDGKSPREWGADAHIEHPQALLDVIGTAVA